MVRALTPPVSNHIEDEDIVSDDDESLADEYNEQIWQQDLDYMNQRVLQLEKYFAESKWEKQLLYVAADSNDIIYTQSIGITSNTTYENWCDFELDNITAFIDPDCPSTMTIISDETWSRLIQLVQCEKVQRIYVESM